MDLTEIVTDISNQGTVMHLKIMAWKLCSQFSCHDDGYALLSLLNLDKDGRNQ